jgi:hypothetical protein
MVGVMQVDQKTARSEKLEHDAGLQSFHDYVCAQLDTPRRDEILQRAAQRIGLWKQNKLCSSYCRGGRWRQRDVQGQGAERLQAQIHRHDSEHAVLLLDAGAQLNRQQLHALLRKARELSGRHGVTMVSP